MNWMLSLVEITAFKLESKCCKGLFCKNKFPPMRALEFVTVYNPAYTYKFQLKTTLDFIEAFLCRKSAASSFRRSCIIILTTILAHSFSFSDIQMLSVLISSGKALPLLESKLWNQVTFSSLSRWKILTVKKIKTGCVLWCSKVQISNTRHLFSYIKAQNLS